MVKNNLTKIIAGVLLGVGSVGFGALGFVVNNVNQGSFTNTKASTISPDVSSLDAKELVESPAAKNMITESQSASIIKSFNRSREVSEPREADEQEESGYSPYQKSQYGAKSTSIAKNTFIQSEDETDDD